MPARLNILSGIKYGRWTIIKETVTFISHRKFLCKCNCGIKRTVRLTHLIQGVSMSCGCLHKELSAKRATKHGYSTHPIYRVWFDMMRRCYNEKHRRFKDWGGRGIKVCKEWHDAKTFIEWGTKSGYKQGLLIERIDNNKGYSPDNCKWTTMKEQANNRRTSKLITFQGKTMSETQWAESLGITQPALHERLVKDWSIEKALTIRNLQPKKQYA